ncbi:hypothetical protein BaRGS_00009272 [Batillaria attramentaria]
MPSYAFRTRWTGHFASFTAVYCSRLRTHLCLYHTISGLLHQRIWAFCISHHLCTAAACVHISARVMPSLAFRTRWTGHFASYTTCVLQPPAYTFLSVSCHLMPFAPDGLAIMHLSPPVYAATCVHISACIIPSQAFCTRGSGHFASLTTCVLQPPAYTFLPVSCHLMPFAPDGLAILHLTPPVYCSHLRTHFCPCHATFSLSHQMDWPFCIFHKLCTQPPAYTSLPVSYHLRPFAPEGLGILHLTPPVYCSRLRTHFSPCHAILCLSHQMDWPFCISHHLCTAATCVHISARVMPPLAFRTR